MAKADKFEKRFDRKREEKKRQDKLMPTEDDPPLPPPPETIQNKDKAPGRNDPCSCGSNKKYKQCCGRA